jgi:hypothetical protein
LSLKNIEIMFETENIYENIRGVINSIPENFKILEETIDIEVQKEFFESTNNIIIDPEKDILQEMISGLNQSETSVTDCKLLLQKLALIDSVEAYRAIEAYAKNPSDELKEWSILALQQSKMVLHCSLLDEQQVFISTGLGGKNDKLRYFLIFPFNHTVKKLSKIQKETLIKELEYFLSNHNGETEYTEFYKNYATAMTLIPLKAPIPEIIREVLKECNQFGDFLSPDIMITNMKKLAHDEITQIISGIGVRK